MKNNKSAFTLVELLVVFTIIVVIGMLIIPPLMGIKYEGKINPYFNPCAAQAQAQQDMVDAMREQNRIMQERLDRLEAQQNAK